MNPQSETVETARLAVDSAIGGNAAKATVAGAATLVYGGYTINDMAIAVGAAVAVIRLVVQIVSQIHSATVRVREDRRKEEMHQLRMQMLRHEAEHENRFSQGPEGEV